MARAATHGLGAPWHTSGRRAGRGQRRVCGAQAGGGSGGGAEAADLGEPAFDAALVAGEEHRDVRVQFVASGRPHHLALPAVHELVAVGKGLAPPREEHLLAHRVPARQRLRARAGA